VDVAFPVEDEQLAAWAVECDVRFALAAPWIWHQDGAAMAEAGDLLQGEFSRAVRAAPRRLANQFRWALGLAGVALVLHVGATVVEWTALRVAQWRTAQATVSAARGAGIVSADDAATAASSVARTFTDARHRAGLAAPSDAIPLLARAAPAVGALPGSTLKVASYTPGQWTFDFAKIDAGMLSRLEQRLREHGLASIAAVTASGLRMRVTLAPGADAP
jgi:hypothetical protein